MRVCVCAAVLNAAEEEDGGASYVTVSANQRRELRR